MVAADGGPSRPLAHLSERDAVVGSGGPTASASPTARGAASWTMRSIPTSRRTPGSSPSIRRIRRRSRRASCTHRRPRIRRCAGRRTASGSRSTRTRISPTTSGCGPRPADAAPRRISFLGRGAEVGWPRWSPDGKWLLFDGASKASHRSVMFVAGVDQESGAVTREPVELALQTLDAEVSHAEWLADSAHIVVLGKEGARPARDLHAGARRRPIGASSVRRGSRRSTMRPGLAASPDGRDIAFIAPAPRRLLSGVPDAGRRRHAGAGDDAIRRTRRSRRGRPTAGSWRSPCGTTTRSSGGCAERFSASSPARS